MKRLHINISVEDLDTSIAFYAALFGTEPTKQKDDYAKWMLDDPRVNFSIAQSRGRSGIEHLGIQAEDEAELEELYANAERAGAALREEGHTVCCYAASEKSWARDPQGVEWELFRSYGESATFYAEDAEGCCDSACCTEEAAA